MHLVHILFALLMVRKLEFFINERSPITLVLTDLDTLFFSVFNMKSTAEGMDLSPTRGILVFDFI